MSFTCPRCGATSHNSTDEREGYCGACHAWTWRAQDRLGSQQAGNEPVLTEGQRMSETTPETPDVDADPAPVTDVPDSGAPDTAGQTDSPVESLPAETPVGPGDEVEDIPVGQQENPMAGQNSDPESQEPPAEAQQPGALDSPTVSTPLVETGPGPQDEQLDDDQPAPHAPFDPSGVPGPELAPGGHS